MTSDLSTDHLATARSYAAEPYSWPVAPRFNPSRYWYTRLTEQPDHAAWLTTWLPGQAVHVHEHTGPGAFYVLRGDLTEEIIGPDGTVTSRLVRSGFGHTFAGPYRHRLVNRSALPAVGLHVYAAGSA
jgi:hypothetical protein